MAPNLGSAWRSFWHTMTSNDRHASHDSPYRTGQHVPLNQSRHAPLTSVATSAAESRADLASSYDDDGSKRLGSITTNGWPGSPTASLHSPSRPYSPGMRSTSSLPLAKETQENDTVSPGEIQMQSFHEGAPPPPPVSHSWKKIDQWAERNYEELFDQLGGGCTQNDVNELEHELDCTLPLEVRESLGIHDGQERGGLPTGIVFGCMLLDCEEIVQEWKNWKTVNEEYLTGQVQSRHQFPSKAFGSSSSASGPPSQQTSNPLWRQELLDRQESQPPKSIQKAYAHPSWIPLARDWGGNNIAVDLAPGPMGKWGQVIIFGRDYDCKYVVARSWAAFLAVVADDVNSEKTFVDEDSGELKLKEFKTGNVEPGYLDILRWRSDQKYGRKGPKRKPTNGALGLNTNVNGRSGRDSPYGSPTLSNDDRGRSPIRPPNRSSTQSPRGAMGISSPLARVTEEMAAPTPLRIGGDIVRDFAAPVPIRAVQAEKLIDAPTPIVSESLEKKSVLAPKQKLVDAPTPIVGEDFEKKAALGTRDDIDDKENRKEPDMAGLGVDGVDGMKSVDI